MLLGDCSTFMKEPQSVQCLGLVPELGESENRVREALTGNEKVASEEIEHQKWTELVVIELSLQCVEERTRLVIGEYGRR